MPDRVSNLIPRVAMLLAAATALGAAPLGAQSSAKSKAPATTAAPSIVGTWAGKATVPLPDSTVVVPVFYTFTQSAGTVSGSAMVPGYGSGPISHVVQTGNRVQFHVTAPEGKVLEHEGTFGADGSIEGMVNLDNAPVAQFKISPKPVARPTK